MSEEEGLEATVGSLVAAYESGNVTSDVTETLQQLLPFSRYCRYAPANERGVGLMVHQNRSGSMVLPFIELI